MRALLTVLLVIGISGCELETGSLKVGQMAPPVKTKTLQDVGGDFSRITSYRYPDERMYRYSLSDVVAKGKPVLLEFATPGHCTVCDVQLQMLKGVLSKYEGQVVFLHMDQYQNPEAFKAFGVMGDPWTYIIDGQGKVFYRQAGSMLFQEVDGLLAKLMRNGGNA